MGDKEKVYCVMSESVYNGETNVTCDVFSSYKKAQSFFRDLVKSTKESDHLFKETDDEDLIVIEDEEASFCVYEDGRYLDDHYSAWIIDREIK